MALPTYYSTGVATIANGATTVAFAGALLGTAEAPNFKPGDLFMDPAQPLVPPQRIASVNYNDSEASLAVGWPGTALTADPYEVRFVDDITRSTAQTRRYLEMLGQLTALGIQPQGFGTGADRDEYDEQKAGFIFLDIGTPWTLYIRETDTPGVWDAGQPVEGAPGPVGPSGLVGVWRGEYSGPTAYDEADLVRKDGSAWIALQPTTGNAPPTLPTTSNAYWELATSRGDKGDPGNDGADGTDGVDGIMSSVQPGTGIAVDSTDPANPVVGLSTTTQNTIASKITMGGAIAAALIMGG